MLLTKTRISLFLAAFSLCSLLTMGQLPGHYYFQMNEGTGTTTADLASPGHNTSPVSSMTWDSANPIVGASSLSTAYTGNVQTNAPLSISGDWTIEFWYRHNAAAVAASPSGVSTIAGDSSANFFIHHVAFGGNPDISINNPGGLITTVALGAAVDATWVHVAFTYDSVNGTSSSYVNGLHSTTVLQPTGVTLNGTQPQGLILGSTLSFSSALGGALDEFRFWDVVRTPTQILNNMMNEVAPLVPGAGQAPQAGLAVFDINNSESPLAGPVTSGDNGPYSVTSIANTPLAFRFDGIPNEPVILLFGSLNVSVASYVGIGQLDIGGPVSIQTGIPTNITVLGDGFSPSDFLDFLFFVSPAGSTTLGFVTPQLPPGVVGTFQTLFGAGTPGTVAISNAVILTIM